MLRRCKPKNLLLTAEKAPQKKRWPRLLCCARLTDEIKETFVGMGSSFITSLKLKDNWVFVGRAATKTKSAFEKVSEVLHASLFLFYLCPKGPRDVKHIRLIKGMFFSLSHVSKLLTTRKRTLMRHGQTWWRWPDVSPEPQTPHNNRSVQTFGQLWWGPPSGLHSVNPHEDI